MDTYRIGIKDNEQPMESCKMKVTVQLFPHSCLPPYTFNNVTTLRILYTLYACAVLMRTRCAYAHALCLCARAMHAMCIYAAPREPTGTCAPSLSRSRRPGHTPYFIHDYTRPDLACLIESDPAHAASSAGVAGTTGVTCKACQTTYRSLFKCSMGRMAGIISALTASNHPGKGRGKPNQ